MADISPSADSTSSVDYGHYGIVSTSRSTISLGFDRVSFFFSSNNNLCCTCYIFNFKNNALSFLKTEKFRGQPSRPVRELQVFMCWLGNIFKALTF